MSSEAQRKTNRNSGLELRRTSNEKLNIRRPEKASAESGNGLNRRTSSPDLRPQGALTPTTTDFRSFEIIPLDAQQKENVRKLSSVIVQGGVEKLKREYEHLKQIKYPELTKTAMSANLKKCRYKDVPCWDHTRVHLTFPPNFEPPNDFIHANFIKHESLLNTFICTQGPLDSTVCDFWRMIWQERCYLIIMLCQCVELKRTKCSQYWPINLNETKVVGPFKITTFYLDTSDPNIIVTKMSVRYGETEIRDVEHRHWTTWPDKSVPKNSSSMFKLLKLPKELPAFPTIVHCSAGVGRTGSLILSEVILRSLLGPKGNDIRPVELLKEIRKQRSHSMIQTEDQFVYVHFSIVQFAVAHEILTIGEVEEFFKSYSAYLASVNAATEKGGKSKTPRKAGSVRRSESSKK